MAHSLFELIQGKVGSVIHDGEDNDDDDKYGHFASLKQ